jgi:multiple sugar transport system permease protein
MAEFRSRGEKIGNRVSIVAVVVALIVMLTPIYWIASTAFKARHLATTIPPTVVFEPTLAPFAKLFTKRSQLREPVDAETYAAAPWWEKLVYDVGEQVV